MPRIYTKTGDDGYTGLLFGGRISKGDLATDAYGTTDEAVAALGLARSLCEDPDMREDILVLQRELFVVGADLAANPAKRRKLDGGVSLVTEDMVGRLERRIDALVTQRPLPSERTMASRSSEPSSRCARASLLSSTGRSRRPRVIASPTVASLPLRSSRSRSSWNPRVRPSCRTVTASYSSR